MSAGWPRHLLNRNDPFNHRPDPDAPRTFGSMPDTDTGSHRAFGSHPLDPFGSNSVNIPFDPQREQLDRMTRTPWNGETAGNSPRTVSEERVVRQFQDEMRIDRQRHERDMRDLGDELVRQRMQIDSLRAVVKELTDDKKKREDAAAAQIARPTPAAAAEAIEASTKRPRKTEPVDPDADVDDKLNK